VWQKRFDIQFLRGVAVLVVVLFHAVGEAFPRGYLGVDIFFVISGFLITTIILRDLAAGRFSFTGFYLRRARRLLPASFATLIGSTALALVLLTSSQLRDYMAQLLGTLTFSANFVLAQQTDYFADAAEMKPLLHTWSLSLEEQFYFLTPLVLWLTPLRSRPWILLAGTVASLALCLALASGSPLIPWPPQFQLKLAFFMLPARAWELLLGALCGWLMLRKPGLALPRWLKFVGLAALFAGCMVGFDDIHPRGDSLVVTSATALLLLGDDRWLPANLFTRLVTTIGDWSYSLYLVHWPLFSFAIIAYGGTPPLPVVAALALVALVLAWLQFTYVEERYRRPPASGAVRRRRIGWTTVDDGRAGARGGAAADGDAPAVQCPSAQQGPRPVVQPGAGGLDRPRPMPNLPGTRRGRVGRQLCHALGQRPFRTAAGADDEDCLFPRPWGGPY
jgi:peptidoglycan/LPS O-acetylase OafA/YrhL